jgi:hypothetical protein
MPLFGIPLRLPPVLLPSIVYFIHFGPETAMALKIIICVTGPGNTGKSCIIREFTARHLKYRKAKGDVLGIFRMPQLRYAVGVTGGGDNPEVIREGLDFLTRYARLNVLIVASHSRGNTIQEVKTFARRANAKLHLVPTKRLADTRKWAAAISTNVSKIRGFMPGRSRRAR